MNSIKFDVLKIEDRRGWKVRLSIYKWLATVKLDQGRVVIIPFYSGFLERGFSGLFFNTSPPEMIGYSISNALEREYKGLDFSMREFKTVLPLPKISKKARGLFK